MATMSTYLCDAAVILLLLLLVDRTVKTVYRLYFHPLSHIPGPWLAKVSYLWSFYWDVLQDGRRLHQYPRLHRLHGPVIRIAPNEVHINSSAAYHTVFAPNPAFLKDPGFYGTVGEPNALLLMTDPARARARRDILGPLFSKRAVGELEDVIQGKVQRLCGKIDDMIGAAERRRGEGKGAVVPLQNAFYCTTVDIISQYSFGSSLDVLDAPQFESQDVENVLGVSDGLWIGSYFPILKTVAVRSPRWLASLLAKNAMSFVWKCEDLVARQLSTSPTTSVPNPHAQQHTTIFNALQAAATRKSHDGSGALTFRELADEAVMLLFAGTDTTANTLTYAVWYFITLPDVRRRVLAEIDAERGRQGEGKAERGLSLAGLERLPYLVCTCAGVWAWG